MPPLLRHNAIYRSPRLVIGIFLLLIGAGVLGLIAWKAVASRGAILGRAEEDIKNLAHSLAEHVAHTLKAPDVAMTGMADLLKYQNPLPQRFNAYLLTTIRSMSQINEIGVLNAAGDWRYTSSDYLPDHNNSDRPYFAYHRDNSDPRMLVSGPIISMDSGRPSIILSKRISAPDGQFAGVVVATIDCEYFRQFYRSFDIGAHGGITLLLTDGSLLTRWPSVGVTQKQQIDAALFKKHVAESRARFSEIVSPFDSVSKYFAYERSPEYPAVVTVARSKDELLASWRAGLVSDVLVGGLLIAIMVGMAAVLNSQFTFRTRLEQSLRERETRHRLLADNIADIVIIMDRKGYLRYLSPSVSSVLGVAEGELLGRSCLDVVHESDREKVADASRSLKDRTSSRSVQFRIRRKDGETIWLEAHFKIAERSVSGKLEIVGVLRDVTQKKALEEELSSANTKLAQLATTDGLTRLANRRSFDAFVRDAYSKYDILSVLLMDIDNFKSLNDALGHQVGDHCLQQIAEVIGNATANTAGLSARYGGEEFALVLPGLNEVKAVKVADAIRTLVQRLQIYHPQTPLKCVTVSVGVAEKSLATPGELALIRDADIALYQAKELGRNRTVASSSFSGSSVLSGSLAPALTDLEWTHDAEQEKGGESEACAADVGSRYAIAGAHGEQR